MMEPLNATLKGIAAPALYGFKANFNGHAGCHDSARLLPQRCLVPARVLSVVSADVGSIVDDDRPNPRRSAGAYRAKYKGSPYLPPDDRQSRPSGDDARSAAETPNINI